MLKKTYEKGSMKPESAKAKAPVAKPHQAVELHDGGGMQKSLHVAKSQPRVMRFIKR